MAKITMKDGTVFVGNAQEYAEFYWAQEKLRKLLDAEEEAVVELAEPALKAGDYVKVVDASGHTSFTEGEIRVITTVDGSDVPYRTESLDGTTFNWSKASRLVKATDAEVAAAQTPKEPALKVGDYARLKTNRGALVGFAADEVVKIIGEEDSDGDYRVQGISHGVKGYSSGTNLERVTKPAEPALKVGDYAKVVPHNNTNYFGGKPGDIVKIVRVSDRYTTEELDGGNFGQNPNALREALVKATDKEVAEAKAKAAESAKWAKLGRKVNEFRRGDIVEVLATCGAGDGIKKGDLIEVVEDSTPGRTRVKAQDMSTGAWSVRSRLITPVESRFDRA